MARTRRSRPEAQPRAVVIHGLAQAEAALAAAAAAGVAVALWSAEGASASGGAGWFKAVVEAAARRVPAAEFTAVLDCADMPGHVLGAFRSGIAVVRFGGGARVAAKLADIAGQQGCRLLRRRPPALLDLREVADPAAACERWLGAER